MARLSPEYVVAALMQRGVPKHVAQGVAMNLQDESGLETGINERNPTAGRGGYGLAQWTGSRRTALENYARSRGVSADDPNAQFDYFMQENQGPEAKAWSAVMASPDERSAAQNFVRLWERPSKENMANRVTKYAGMTGVEPGSYNVASAAPAGPVGPGGNADIMKPSFSPEKNKPPSISDQLTGSMGDIANKMMAGAASPAPLQGVQMAKPEAYFNEPVAANTINPQGAQAARNKLAMAMQRLNTGRLG
jgi:Phage tail lysozyme